MYRGAHFIAVTSWFNFFSVQKNIKEDEKFNYFVGLGGFLWANSVVCTVAGYLFSNLVPHEILIALVFINPMYFLVMTVSNLEEKKIICSIFVGATLSIFLNDVFPGWSVLIAGVLAGTLGFFIFRKENNE